MENGFYNMDCMVGMKEFPDKYFDIAIVDPPYGSSLPVAPAEQEESENTLISYISVSRSGGHLSRYKTEASPTDISDWDYAPPPEYFRELARVSKNQIIWGGNYFDLPPTRCFLVWRKCNIPLEGFTMAPVEYAWTSFNQNAKLFEAFSSVLAGKEKRFHPTQKPVELYEWQLGKFANPGDKILDTHVGSASSLIACHRMGHEYVGFELDKGYFDLAKERLEAVKAQMSLF